MCRGSIHDGLWAGDRAASVDTSYEPQPPREVPSDLTIDGCWQRLGLVKNDAEGADGQVWAGMREARRRFPGIVTVMELHIPRDPAGAEQLLNGLADEGVAIQAVEFDGTVRPVPVPRSSPSRSGIGRCGWDDDTRREYGSAYCSYCATKCTSFCRMAEIRPPKCESLVQNLRSIFPCNRPDGTRNLSLDCIDRVVKGVWCAKSLSPDERIRHVSRLYTVKAVAEPWWHMTRPDGEGTFARSISHRMTKPSHFICHIQVGLRLTNISGDSSIQCPLQAS